jgi:predicted DNA-binding transcriptional regulator AlpA
MDTTAPDRIIPLTEVLQICGISQATQWRLEHAGVFPEKISLSSRRVGWSLRSVLEWVEGRKGESAKDAAWLPSPPRRGRKRVECTQFVWSDGSPAEISAELAAHVPRLSMAEQWQQYRAIFEPTGAWECRQ